MSKQFLKFIISIYVICAGYVILMNTILFIINKNNNIYSITTYVISNTYNYGMKFTFIFGAMYVTNKFIINKININLSIFIHTLFSIGLSFYSALMLLTYEKYVLGYTDFEINGISLTKRTLNGSDYNFFIYFTIIAIFYAYHFLKNKNEKELMNATLKSKFKDSKILSLQSQLQPHFLFNALNGISSLIGMDAYKSQEAIVDLSDFLRSTINLKETKLHTLYKEVELAKSYLKIEELRYDEKLSIQFRIQENTSDFLVPPLLLQPILENSIKHGFSYYNDYLSIFIEVSKTANQLQILIKNDGKALEQNDVIFGNGLANILDRLEVLYKDNFQFKIYQSEDKHVINKIRIPLEKQTTNALTTHQE